MNTQTSAIANKQTHRQTNEHKNEKRLEKRGRDLNTRREKMTMK